MSWSADMRCLYCDGKLPLYRKITHGQFCSTAHRKAYWLEQEQLAVERLHQTHNSLRAYRPTVPAEAILGPASSTPLPPPQITSQPHLVISQPIDPAVGGFVRELPLTQWSQVAPMVIAEEPVFEIDCHPEEPVFSVPAMVSRRIGAAELIALSGLISAQNHPIRPRIVDLGRRDVTLLPCCEYASFGANLFVPATKLGEFVRTSRVAEPTVASPRIVTLSPLPLRLPRPTFNRPLALLAAELTPEHLAEPMAAEDEIPFCHRLFSLLQFQPHLIGVAPPAGMGERLEVVRPALLLLRDLALAVQEVAFSSRMCSLPRVTGNANWPIVFSSSPVGVDARLDAMLPALLFQVASLENEVPFSSRMHLLPHTAATVNTREFLNASPVGMMGPLDTLPATLFAQRQGAPVSPRTVPGAGLAALAMPQVPLAHGTVAIERRIESLGGAHKGIPSEESRIAMVTPPLYPQLRMANGQRYAVEFRGTRVQPPVPEPTECFAVPADIALPQATDRPYLEKVREDFVPESAGLVPLGFRKELAASEPAAPAISRVALIPQPLCSGPIRPSSKLEPIDGKPLADAMQPEAPSAGLGFSGMGMPLPRQAAPAAKMPLWAHAAGFWKHAPRDLKLLAFAIPALLALAFHPALPKVAIAAPPTTGKLKRSITSVVSGELASFRKVVYDRAAVALDEDFRSGLDDWVSRGDATTQWSFDATGFVRPGPLALYRPSMNLTDYEMQFLGMIDQKALSWVVRATDFNNYYVVKMMVLKPGPQTTVGITRYAVIDGRAQDRVDTAVAIDARPDTLYRVVLDLHGDDFALTVQGQMIDSWSDKRLRRGGIGFFTARGEESRVRWVQVTHQYDTLGRLCAYLAPYEIPTTNGSW